MRDLSRCAHSSSGLRPAFTQISSRVNSAPFASSSSEVHCGRHFILRTCVRAAFLTMLCSQVENVERPWNCLRFLKAKRSPSCSASSESCGSRNICLAVLLRRGIQEVKRSFSSTSLILTGNGSHCCIFGITPQRFCPLKLPLSLQVPHACEPSAAEVLQIRFQCGIAAGANRAGLIQFTSTWWPSVRKSKRRKQKNLLRDD
jgi:hypothetical protein